MTTREDSNPRPVVAIDVDGVLNASSSPDVLGAGWEHHRVAVPAAHVPKSPFIAGHGQRDLVGTVCLNSGLHGRWMSELREHADLVWATAWEEGANYGLAPLLGVDPLPLGLSVSRNPPRFGYARSRDSAGLEGREPGRQLRRTPPGLD